MKVWKRGKKKMRVSPEYRWERVGYYRNRPKLLSRIEIGNVDSMRFVSTN